MSQGTYTAITIASGGTTSTTYETKGANRGSFQLPTMTGVATTVKVSNDGTNWTTCPIEGNEVSPIVTTSNGTYSLPIKAFNFRYIQLVSGSAEGADRTINVFTRD